MIDRLGDARVLVVGDAILDRYTWGNAERVSPEAPVLVLRADEREVRLGGAASVAMLLRGLAADVTLASVVGDDCDGRVLRRLLDEAGSRPIWCSGTWVGRRPRKNVFSGGRRIGSRTRCCVWTVKRVSRWGRNWKSGWSTAWGGKWLGQAAGWELVETAELANVAAGLEAEKMGVAPVSWDEIRAERGTAACEVGGDMGSKDRPENDCGA